MIVRTGEWNCVMRIHFLHTHHTHSFARAVTLLVERLHLGTHITRALNTCARFCTNAYTHSPGSIHVHVLLYKRVHTHTCYIHTHALHITCGPKLQTCVHQEMRFTLF
jgi:hypothetical protein